MIGFGGLDILTDKDLILSLTFFFQIIGGLGTGIILPCAMAIVSTYKDRREEFIGYIELTSGLGAICGPLFGAGFWMLFGYAGPFVGIGIMFLLVMIYFYCNRDKI